MLVPITLPTGFIERHEIRTGAIERANFDNYAVVFAQSDASTPDDFDVNLLIGAKIKSVQISIDDPERVFTIIGGYYVEPQGNQTAITTRVFGIAKEPSEGFLMEEGGSTVLANHWKLINVDSGPILQMDERKRGGKGWTFIVQEVFPDRGKYPLSGEPMDIWVDEDCPAIINIDEEILDETAVSITYRFTAVMRVADKPASSYTWDFGDGSPPQSGQIVTHEYVKEETPRMFSVTCDGEVSQGCNATSHTEAFAVAERTCPVIVDIEGVPSNITATTIEYQFTAVLAEENEGALSYTWDFGDGSDPGEGQAVSHVYEKGDTPLSVDVAVVGEVPEGCQDTSQTKPFPIPGATCPEIVEVFGRKLGEDAVSVEYEFSLNVADDDQGILFTWDMGDGSPPKTGRTVRHLYEKKETDKEYTVSVIGEGPSDCPPASAFLPLNVPERACPVIARIEKEKVGEDAVSVEYKFTAVMAEDDEPALSYEWDFGDNTPNGFGQMVNHIYAREEENKVYTVTATGEVPQECEATSATIEAEVKEKMCPVIARVLKEVIRQNAIEIEYKFTAEMVEPEEPALSYEWDFGDDTEKGTGQMVTHVYARTDTDQEFDVVVTGEVPEQCAPTSGATTVNVSEMTCPVIALVEREKVSENAIQVEYKFTAVMVEPEELALSYEWDFGDGSPKGTGQMVTHTYRRGEEDQVFNVTVTGEVPDGCDATSGETTAPVTERRCAVIASIAQEKLSENAIEVEYKFTAVMAEEDEPALSYEWDFGDGSPKGSGQMVTHTYRRGEEDQVFNVAVTGEVPEECEATSAATTVDVSERACPVIASIEVEEVSQNAIEVEYKFTAVMAEEDEPALSYEWDFGDGEPKGTGQMVMHTYRRGEEDQVFNVTVTGEVPEECDPTSATTTVTVTEKRCPVIASIVKEVMSQNAIEIEYKFTAVMAEEDEPALSYEWDFGDDTPKGSGQMVTHTYRREEEDQVYNVTVTGEVPEECEATSAATTAEVSERACPVIVRIEKEEVSQNAIQVECKFTAVMAEDDEPCLSYEWDFGDGGPKGSGQMVMHTFRRGEEDQVLNVTVTGEVPEECDPTSATLTVEISERACPVIASIEKEEMRQNAIEIEYKFTAVMAEPDELALSYEWDFGDGEPKGTGQMVTHVYARQEEDQDYDVTVTGGVPAECDATSAATTVSVTERRCAVIASIEMEEVRQNAIEVEYKFTAVMAEPDELATAYTWDFGDGSTPGTGQEVNHVYMRKEEDKEYTVTVTGEVPDVCDDTSATTTATVTENTCPVIESIDKQVVEETDIVITYEFTAVLKEPDEAPTTYTWTFGDDGSEGGAEGEVVRHTYVKKDTAEDYEVKVVGEVPSECGSVEVTTNAAVGIITCPTISIQVTATDERDEEVEYQFEVTVRGEMPDRFEWDFGDQTPPIPEGSLTESHVYPIRPGDDKVFTVRVRAYGPESCLTENEVDVDVPGVCPELVGVLVEELDPPDDKKIKYRFTAQTGDLEADTYTWVFGDGKNDGVQGKTVEHIYDRKSGDPVLYVVQVTSNGPENCTDNESTTVTIPGLCPEVEKIETEDLELTNEVLSVKVALTITEGEPAEYIWDWGDGSDEETTTTPENTHDYAREDGDADLYQVRVKVKGPGRCSCTATTQVVVPGRCPTISSIDIVEEVMDATTKTVKFSLVIDGPQPTSYVWDWGDGSPTTPTTEPEAEHTYTRPIGNNERYTLTVTGQGPEGCGCISSELVEVEGACSELESYEYAEVSKDDEKQTIKIDLVTTEPMPDKYRWYWNDGTGHEDTEEPTATHDFSRPVGDDAVVKVRVDLIGPEACSTQTEVEVTVKGICPSILAVPVVYAEPTMTEQGISIDLVTSGPDAERFEWDWGDNSTPLVTTEPSASYTYPRTPGEEKTYVVKVTAIVSDCCKDVAQNTVIVHGACPAFISNPVITIEQPGELTQKVTVQVSASEPRPEKYRWNWGDNSPEYETTEATQSHDYERAEGDSVLHDITVTLVGPGECSQERTVQALVKGRCPEVENIVLQKLDQTASTHTVKLTLTVSGAVPTEYVWDWGDGTIDSSGSPVKEHTYARPAGPEKIYNAKVYVNGPGSCACPVFVQVNVPGACPDIGEITVDSEGIDSEKQHFGFTLDVGPLKADQYIWTWGDNSPPEPTRTPQASHTYNREANEAIFDVRVIAIGPGMCSEESVTTVAVEGTCPSIECIEVSYGTLSEEWQYVKFFAAVKGDEKPNRYEWDFGDGHTDVTTEPWAKHKYARPVGDAERYRVSVKSRGPACPPDEDCVDTAYEYVKVAGECGVITDGHAIYGDGDEFEVPVTVLVTMRGDKPNEYTWDWGDNSTSRSTQPHQTHMFARPTEGSVTYNVKVATVARVSNKSQKACVSEEEILVVVHAYSNNGEQAGG